MYKYSVYALTYYILQVKGNLVKNNTDYYDIAITDLCRKQEIFICVFTLLNNGQEM